ncbi:TolC family protein [Thioalkalivibrio paradoxus]|uniref:Transporter n=1 Tax=Thioalkalivibrio paradoxus ARh 1 TaxID=713585 RepID=W0DLT3_9GAMM|nr:TolC family protein [Thioalkalivibrio paradoxus]AHE99416.1 transporter [Thioalkalivibrio paradoxus ARh 1]
MPIRDLCRSALAGSLIALSAIATANAGAPDPLPQPLRLEAALAAIDAEHPALVSARALRARAEQALEGEHSRSDLTIDAHLEARWIEPNDHAPDDGNDDSRALLTARKLLSDFGQNRSRVAAGEREVDARVADEAIAHARHRLAVMGRYFDVLLADLAFARDTEAMASAFVSLERARDRNELGQVSDIDLFQLESEYQTARGQRLRALQTQRRSRAALAEALNRPGQAPAQVLGPMLPLDLPALPDLDRLLATVDAQNPELLVRRAEVEAARHRADAARAMNRPRLSAELQAGAWAREFGGDRNPVAASLILEIPLYQGRGRSAALGEATADRHLAEADLAQAMIEARNTARDLFYEIEALLVQRDEALARMDYRELYIDRARALYDMEETTDLGDSMVQQSAAAHFNAATEYALALAFERLALLLGDPSLSPFPPDASMEP